MAKTERDIEEFLESILVALSDDLESILVTHSVTGYINGADEMVKFAAELLPETPLQFEGPPMQQAITWANKRAAEMVTKMNDETKRRLSRIIAEGIENKRGIPGLAKDIREEFDLMTKYRSRMIARTETAQALSEGSLQRMKDMGVTGKRWVTVGDDKVSDICMQNAAAGAIGVDAVFPSGHSGPPSHPQCRCVASPVMLRAE